MTISTQRYTTQAPAATSTLEDLRRRLTGELITSADAAFEEARKVHDITVDRRPALIVRAATAEDVSVAVRFARDNGFELAVRSGGHSIAHQSMVDGALVIDLSAMRAVHVDPASRTARVQPGATSEDIAGPAHAYGLALTTGDTSSVGIGGLATGGGIGWMVRKYGLTIDNMLSAQVVTAAGEIVTASEASHPDLFWAVRGGGGNFGVVTEFEFRLAPVGQIYGGDLMLPATPEVIRGYLDYAVSAPDELTTITNLMHAPPAPFVPADRVGELVIDIIVCWTGSVEDGEKALAPLRALATPVADTVAPIPYPVIYMSTAPAAAPHAASVRSMFTNHISDETIADVLAAMEQVTSPISMVQLRAFGGAMARVPADATAFAHRDKRFQLTVLGLWLDAADDDAPHRRWAESLWEQVRRDADGTYVNFLEQEGDARLRDAYPEATYRRLAEIKRRYDPANLFHHNQNIRP